MTFDIATHLPPAIARFALNERGRDYVVGDIHGMFRHLERLLEEIDFDPEVDRLFSVGDLVDRGPASRDATKWLQYPWFHACRGNHEQFAIDSTDAQELDFWVRFNGGEWWLELSGDEQRAYREAFRQMPMAMEIETGSGRVGVVHADVPPSLSWERFCDLLDARHPDVQLYALFSRNRIHGPSSHSGIEGGVDRIYCGHTPVRDPVTVDNVHFIDTGAVYASDVFDAARLTLVEIHPQPHQVHHISTGDKP